MNIRREKDFSFLKGQCHEIFRFSFNHIPLGDNSIGTNSIFVRKFTEIIRYLTQVAVPVLFTPLVS
jgi:hypothetical protein